MIDHAFQHTRVAPLESNSHPSPSMRSREIHRLGVLDGHLNVDSGLDLDLSHLTDDIRGAVEVNEALVDAHLVPIEGSRTVTGRRLAHREHEVLRGHADGPFTLRLSWPRARNCSLAERMRSAQTFSSERTLRLVRVMRMREASGDRTERGQKKVTGVNRERWWEIL